MPGELIQVFGDWSSEAYKSYLEFALPAKLRVSRAVGHALLTLIISVSRLFRTHSLFWGFGGQRVLFLLISRFVFSIINKILSMPNKMCVLTSWFAGDISGNLFAAFVAEKRLQS